MPQRIAISHMFGALAATLVGIAEFYTLGNGAQVSHGKMAALGFEVLFGSLTITGSFMAFGKLQELIPGRPITYPGQNVVNIGPLRRWRSLLFGYLVYNPSTPGAFYLMCALGLCVGVLIVLPIGGADMPVVISLLNSYAGLASSATGLRPRQQRAHHRRRARRRVGLHPLDPDEQGDEPLVRQRPLRRLREARRKERQDRDRPQREVHQRRGRGHPARLRAARSSWCPATAWRWRRRSTRCASWPTSSRRTAAR